MGRQSRSSQFQSKGTREAQRRHQSGQFGSTASVATVGIPPAPRFAHEPQAQITSGESTCVLCVIRIGARLNVRMTCVAHFLAKAFGVGHLLPAKCTINWAGCAWVEQAKF